MKKSASILVVVLVLLCMTVLSYADTVAMVESAKVVSNPTRTTYAVGETFNPAGLKVVLSYTNGSSTTIDSGFPERTVTNGINSISYYINGVAVSVPINVITKSDRSKINRSNISFAPSHVVYISGYDDGTFKPKKELTRAEALAMLCRIVKSAPSATSKITYDIPFVDVDSDDWFYNYIGFLYKNGVLAGKEGDYLNPNGQITRAEFAVYVSRYKDYAKKTLKQVFSDVPTSYWAAEEIQAAYENGWISGYSNGTFNPEGKLTRAESVAIINRMMNRSIDKSSIIGQDIHYFSDVPASNWAYYSIIEASTEHTYKIDYKTKKEIWN